MNLVVLIISFAFLTFSTSQLIAQSCSPPVVCSPPGPPPIAYGQFAYAWDTNTCGWVLVPCTQCNSPILIDTDGSGFHLTSAQGGVLFDFNGLGKPIQIAWTAQGSTNGWLALDRNHNGLIDSAKELFGNITKQPESADKNGFLALALFDLSENGGNNDGLIDSRDQIWPELLVWIDSNHDGISQPAELFRLDSLGIHSISLKYKTSRLVDYYGNQFRYKGRLNAEENTSIDRVIFDVFLKVK